MTQVFKEESYRLPEDPDTQEAQQVQIRLSLEDKGCLFAVLALAKVFENQHSKPTHATLVASSQPLQNATREDYERQSIIEIIQKVGSKLSAETYESLL